jgi:hypothetical protein
LKDFSDLSSVTVKKFHAPSLHLVAAGRGLDKPARGRRVSVAEPRRIGAHEKPHAASTLGGELQPPRLDLAQTLNERDCRADTATAQAFGHRPKLVRAICAAQQNQIPKVDSCRRQGGQVKLALWITPSNRASVFLRRPGEQQCERLGIGGLSRPEQFMHRATLERTAGRYFVEPFQTCAKAAATDVRDLLFSKGAAQLILISRYLHDKPLPVVRYMLG